MNRIFLLGDIHGDWRPIAELNNRLVDKLDETDIIILLGDVGANYFLDARDAKFKTALGKFGCTFFCIRGNHEERPSNLIDRSSDWFYSEYFNGAVYEEKGYPYIKYAMDHPFLYDINGYLTLVIPGAYSVDKDYRLMKGWNWFKDEQLTDLEKETGRILVDKADRKVDLVLSHTCPIIYEPTDLFLSSINQKFVDKSMERYLGELEYKLDYKLWCWGHFHKFRVYPEYEGRQCIMLFNDAAIELNETMESLKMEGIRNGKTYIKTY